MSTTRGTRTTKSGSQTSKRKAPSSRKPKLKTTTVLRWKVQGFVYIGNTALYRAVVPAIYDKFGNLAGWSRLTNYHVVSVTFDEETDALAAMQWLYNLGIVKLKLTKATYKYEELPWQPEEAEPCNLTQPEKPASDTAPS